MSARVEHRMGCPRAAAVGGWMTLALVWCAPSVGHAYSDPSGFDSSPTDDGGGGGRWFTGSPADGYTCSVCHADGANPDLTITGLPIEGYQPGASYEVIVTWAATLPRVGVNAEVTDESGAGVGTIQVAEGNAVDAMEQCAPEFGPGIPALTVNEVPAKQPQLPSRRVLNVAACGARRLRFLWTAPTEPRGQLWFSGAVVSADAEDDIHHDGVTDFARPITARGGEPVASTVGGCQVSLRSGLSTWGSLVFALALLLRRLVRRVAR